MGKNYDFIIVGQGITGSVLSWRLIEKNFNFLVINNSNKKSSSKSALGLYNPITGKNFVETWDSNEIINEMNILIIGFGTAGRHYFKLLEKNVKTVNLEELLNVFPDMLNGKTSGRILVDLIK